MALNGIKNCQRFTVGFNGVIRTRTGYRSDIIAGYYSDIRFPHHNIEPAKAFVAAGSIQQHGIRLVLHAFKKAGQRRIPTYL